MRAFTLLEVMVVLAIVGVLSAATVPSLVDMAKKAEGDRAMVESASSLAAARDSARSQSQCLDYVQSPTTPDSGPYTLRLFAVNCPDAPAIPGLPRLVLERQASPVITSLSVTALTSGGPVPVTTIHFDRNGALYAPVARMRIDAVVNGATRSYSMYPAAGTINFEEIR